METYTPWNLHEKTPGCFDFTGMLDICLLYTSLCKIRERHKDMKNTTAKKFKYGSLSVVITVVFIALIIGVNLIVSSLDASFNLRVDLTETELYSISPETDVALRAGLGDNYRCV